MKMEELNSFLCAKFLREVCDDKKNCSECEFMNIDSEECLFALGVPPRAWNIESIIAQKVIIGKTYHYFKGGLYRVIDVVENAETGEQMVVYCYEGSDKKYVRSKTEFLEKLDKSKYPDAKQTYRFEVVI